MLYSLAMVEAVIFAQWHMPLSTLGEVSLTGMKDCAAAAAHCRGCVVPLNGSGTCKHPMGTPHFRLSTSAGGNGG